ncbi:MAG: long-chain fatty acid--CoA ligase [Actinomycetota bacterium]|nr:long-chain fatty acid--CoA ligase [Actinomycetota bacterium]
MSATRRGSLAIGRWIRDRAVVTPERTAIDFLGLDRPPELSLTSYAQLDRGSERLAAALLSAGLTAGDRVATLTRNCPEHVELLFACAKARLILTPMNWRLAAPEIAYQLEDAEPAMFFVESHHDELANDALAQARVSPQRLMLARDALDDFMGGDGDAGHIRVDDDDPILLVYTSGTTGMPKGALLTHANCFWTNLSLDRTVDLMTTDVVLQVLPQFHVGGWNVQPLLAWWKGATVVLEPGFDARRALTLIERKRVTTMMGVPATYLFMAEEARFAGVDLSSLRQAVVGGAPMPEALLRTWHERGVDIVQGYGLSEAAPNVLCLPPEDARRKLGYAGKPYPHVEVKLRDAETGRDLLGAASGELAVRGPNVFPGYWRNEEATRRAFVDDWLLTGDVAERDEDGFYRIYDRVKDMFISGGENVYPAEVESVLHDHPQVMEAAVVGVPDERWGEVGVAFVVVREPAGVHADELLELCRRRLAKFKVPKEVRFMAALPRSAVNKVLKTELRERYLSESRRGVEAQAVASRERDA